MWVSLFCGERGVSFFLFERIYPPVEMDCVLRLLFFMFLFIGCFGVLDLLSTEKTSRSHSKYDRKLRETWQLIYVKEKTS